MRCKNDGFTLLELLIVISIMSLLMQLIVPAVQNAREAARLAQCKNNMRQLALAAQNYEAAHQVLPPGFTLKPHKHYVVPYLLPHLEQGTIHAAYHFDEEWDAEKNRPAIETEITLLRCPTAPREHLYMTDYGTYHRMMPQLHEELVEEGVIKERSSTIGALRQGPTRIASLTDGLTNTIIFCEDSARPDSYRYGNFISSGHLTGGRWADPQSRFNLRRRCDGTRVGRGTKLINCTNNNEIYSFHPGGANFAFGGGTVSFISEEVDADVLLSQLTGDADD